MLNRRKSLRIVLIISLVRAFSFAAPAVAKNWNATNGNWNTAANWSPASVPVGGEEVNIVNADGVARTVTLDVNTPSLGLVTINQTGGSAFNTLSIPISNNNTFTSGALLVGGWTGGASGSPTTGRGAVSQASGTVTMADGTDLGLGNGVGSTGTYTLSGGAFVASQSEFIGYSGTGTFTQSAGTNTLLASAVGYLNMGTSAGAMGTYNLSGGSLIANKNEIIGDAGNGIFNQTGGTNTISGASNNLYLGNSSGAVGTYTISNSATLTVGGNLIVGNSGTGTMNIDQSSVYVTNQLSIAGTSTVYLNGGSTLRFNTVSGLNRLVYNGGKVQLTGQRTFGSDATISTLYGATPIIPTGKGLILETAGTHNVNTTLQVNGGSLTNAGDLIVGGSQAGALQFSNYAIVSSTNAYFGYNSFSSTGLVSSGATWNVSNLLSVGTYFAGSLTIQSGATVNANNFELKAPGVLNLNGGTLSIGTYTSGGTVNYSSGTLHLSGSRTIGSDQAIQDFFGGAPNITTGKGLTIDGTATLGSGMSVMLNGGTLSVGQVSNGQNLQLLHGTLNYSQNFTIGAGGPLGATLDLASDMAVNGTLGITNNGLITGDGRITGGTVPLQNGVSGELRGEPGKSLTVTGTATTTNDGQINLYGGMIDFQQNLTNNSGAFISGNGTLKTSGLTNAGIMNFSGLANIVGDVTNNAGAKIISSGGGPTTFHDDVINNGEIRTSAGSFTTFFGATSGSGTYTGTGTVNFEGDLKPGNSPAAISFGGNMALGVGAALKMELGGLTAGSQYDRVTVAGNLALDGALQVSLISGFTPATGNSFYILNWGTRSGTFASVQLPDLGGRIVWDSSQLYTTGALAVTSTFYAGDSNRNSHVDVADVSAMMSALTDLSKYQTTSNLDNAQLLLVANLNTDNVVNNADLQGLIVSLANAGGSGAGSLTAVPEPASSVLLVLGGIVAMGRAGLRGIGAFARFNRGLAPGG